MSSLLSVQCLRVKRNIRALWLAAPHSCQRPISLSDQEECVIKDNSLSSCIGKTSHLSPLPPCLLLPEHQLHPQGFSKRQSNRKHRSISHCALQRSKKLRDWNPNVPEMGKFWEIIIIILRQRWSKVFNRLCKGKARFGISCNLCSFHLPQSWFQAMTVSLHT